MLWFTIVILFYKKQTNNILLAHFSKHFGLWCYLPTYCTFPDVSNSAVGLLQIFYGPFLFIYHLCVTFRTTAFLNFQYPSSRNTTSEGVKPPLNSSRLQVISHFLGIVVLQQSNTLASRVNYFFLFLIQTDWENGAVHRGMVLTVRHFAANDLYREKEATHMNSNTSSSTWGGFK